MKSNYKLLGDFITELNNRDRAMTVDRLLGVSIQKKFIPSIANTVGTDMSTYKIVKRNQFAYGPVTSRNGDQISIALMDDHDEAIVSQAYTSFEVKNINELMPEYLMMWFRRAEFDRFARFKSHGSAREIFSWEDMCNTLLPIPSIQEQKDIVKEYKVLQDRIALHDKLVKNLEDFAKILYKQWFIDFNYPDDNGKPYKASGGEMEFDDFYQAEHPKGWEIKSLREVLSFNTSTLTSANEFKELLYLDTGNITNNEIDEIQSFNLEKDALPSRAKRKVQHNDIIFSTVRPNLKHFGIIKNPPSNMLVSTGFAVLTPKNENIFSELIYLLITSDGNLEKLQAKAEMSVSTYPSINVEDLLNLSLCLPRNGGLTQISKAFTSIFDFSDCLKKEKKLLKSMSNLLLSRLATI
jgi:type I restriction enzyme S subunit